MLPGLKITLVAMAVTVLAIVVVLAGLGSEHGEMGPRLSGTAIQHAGPPLTLVDNPQAESLLRQRVARRSDEVARLLAMPNGPLFAQGNETANDAEAADASMNAPPKTTVAAAPRNEERHAATSAKAESITDERATAAVNEGPLTPIEADDYRRALRRASNVQLAAVVNPPADNAQAATQSPASGADRTALWVPEPRPKPAIAEVLPPVRDSEAERKAAAKRAAARARRIAQRTRQISVPPAPPSWTGPFIPSTSSR
jgi:hypothetical protein